MQGNVISRQIAADDVFFFSAFAGVLYESATKNKMIACLTCVASLIRSFLLFQYNYAEMHLCRYQIYSFTALQVCNYHQQYYRPENLCVIITGQIDPNKVFEAVNPFEEKIIGKVSNLFVQVYSISQFCAK